MKCWTHPKADAVAVCVSCGKGLCKECSIVIAGNNYCKTCVESEKWRAPPTLQVAPPTPSAAPPTLHTAPSTPSAAVPTALPPTPTPKGVPSKAQFTVGGIGSILNVIASIPLLILAIMLTNAIMHGYIPAPEYAEFLYFWPFGGLIMAGIGYLGIRRNYGSAMGIVSFAFAIISLVLLIFFSLVGMSLYYIDSEEWATAQAIQGLWFIPFGITQILWGATHIVSRKFTGKSGLSLATGIILILTGCLTMTLILSFLGMVLFFAAEIMASVLFFKSNVPTVSEP